MFWMLKADNTTVVAYINKQGGAHSYALLQLVVDLFLWLQTQDIAIRARHIPGCLNIFGLWGTPVVDMFATIHNTHLPQFMSPVTEPQALAW